MANITMKPPTKSKAKRSKLGSDIDSSSNILPEKTQVSEPTGIKEGQKGRGEELQPVGIKQKDLNFKVDPRFHKDLKTYALLNDITMTDLLVDLFDFYRNPDDQLHKEKAKERNSVLAK